MSWFSAFSPFAAAESTPADEVKRGNSRVSNASLHPDLRQQSKRSSKASRSNNSLPVEAISPSGHPRGKAKATRTKLLPRWEEDSDSDAHNVGDIDELDPDEIYRRRGYPEENNGVDEPDDSESEDEEEPGDATISTMQLPSYEQTVLKLKNPSLKRHELGDEEDDSDESDQGPQDSAASAQKMLQELKMREKLLEEEKAQKEIEQQAENLSGVNALSASRVIVGVAKVKLNMMKQKMKLYEEAQVQGTEDNLRARKLFSWIASLSVLRRFDEKMQLPEIEQEKVEVYLKNLDPPPPPPPPEEPPDSEEEELHEKYEAMIHRYEKQWRTEGQRVLGKDKFEDIRNMPRNGPAEREKKIIAQKCLEQAREVLAEGEYQELLRKAWRLGDDHAAFSEYNPGEFARRVAEEKDKSSKK